MYTDEQRLALIQEDARNVVDHYSALRFRQYHVEYDAMIRAADQVRAASTLDAALSAFKVLETSRAYLRASEMTEAIRARYLARRGLL